MQRDRVHVAFDQHHRRLAARRARKVERVEAAAFGEQRRLRPIDVFGRRVAQGSATEADHLTAPVADRKHDPVEEPIVSPTAVLLLAHQPGFHQEVLRDSLAREVGRQPAASLTRPSQPEPGDRLFGQSAA
jgi:hypothetical protein